MPEFLLLDDAGQEFQKIEDPILLSDKLVIVMSETKRNVAFFSEAVENAEKQEFKDITEYRLSMLTWYVVDKLTTHDHLYTCTIDDENDVAPLYPFINPSKQRSNKIKGTNSLIKTLLIKVYSLRGRRRPSDENNCRPSQDIEAFAEFQRYFYQNCTSMVFCLEPIQYNLLSLHRKRLLITLRELVEKKATTDEGKQILENVKCLLLVGLAQSNNWVEVLARRILLDEYL
jgi:hypothetical protein